MCGIAGILGPDTDDARRGRLEAMASAIAHRGPDDRGTWCGSEVAVGFGHARLSVVDLSAAGAQPMASADGRFVLATNGEIYNFVELRDELQALGHTFRGHSDTEVMLAAFTEWGLERSLERFNGMFAFGLWDAEEQCLHLVRDRVGEKPLYYARVGEVLAFSSEIRALRRLPGFDPGIDRRALAQLLEFGYVPAPRSIHQQVRKLAAGTRLRVDGAGRLDGPVAWWRATEVARAGLQNPLELSDDEAIDRMDRQVRDAVNRRLVADVPVGAFLSGGIDSSLVVALMQQLLDRPAKTFTIGFEDPRFDESGYARAVADHLGTEHTELRVGAREALDLLPGMPEIYDEPFADPSQVPTFLVSRLARRDVTVVLSGDGGDELFGGYRRYRDAQRLQRRLELSPRALRRGVGAALAFGVERTPLPNWVASVPGRHRLGQAGRLADLLRTKSPDDVFRSLFSLCPDPDRVVLGLQAGTEGDLPDTDLPDTDLPDYRCELPEESLIHRWMCLDFTAYLPEGVLVKLDRASMHVALEGRLPLLDPNLVELAWRLPLSLKVRNGEGKWILRRLLERYVPRQLVDRPKAGFELPIGDWLRGPLRPWLEDLLHSDRLRRQGFFDASIVRHRWRQHLLGVRDWRFFLWSVLMFQSWGDTWSETRPGAPT